MIVEIRIPDRAITLVDNQQRGAVRTADGYALTEEGAWIRIARGEWSTRVPREWCQVFDGPEPAKVTQGPTLAKGKR